MSPLKVKFSINPLMVVNYDISRARSLYHLLDSIHCVWYYFNRPVKQATHPCFNRALPANRCTAQYTPVGLAAFNRRQGFPTPVHLASLPNSMGVHWEARRRRLLRQNINRKIKSQKKSVACTQLLKTNNVHFGPTFSLQIPPPPSLERYPGTAANTSQTDISSPPNAILSTPLNQSPFFLTSKHSRTLFTL